MLVYPDFGITEYWFFRTSKISPIICLESTYTILYCRLDYREDGV